MIEITKTNFNEILENNETIIVDLWAPWCGPCRALGPVIEEVSKRHPEVFFGKINVDNEEELAGLFNVRSIPLVVKIKNKKVIVLNKYLINLFFINLIE